MKPTEKEIHPLTLIFILIAGLIIMSKIGGAY